MNRRTIASIIAALALFLIVLGSILSVDWNAGEMTEVGTERVGSSLFDDYGFTFLVVGLLMFAAMMGGVFLAKEDDK